jgi:hypothetical protein
MEPDERRWLERLAYACQHILSSDDAEPIRHYDSRLLDDIDQLLAQINARLAGAGPPTSDTVRP